MVQRVPVASDSNAASFGARSRGASGCGAQLDHRRREAHQMGRMQQMRVQHRLAVLFHQRGDVAETGEMRRDRDGVRAAAGWRTR